MNDGFYKAFEEKHRGSRELIKTRTDFYIPLLRSLCRIDPDATALDLGCGRGEWLETLKEQGIAARGVDIDEGMLAGARESGLDVVNSDAAEYLKCLPDSSLTLVSAFHLVEHLAFSDLQTLVKESLRVLKPGGVLIMETPNPENISVGTSGFYLDPTHKRPIPPQLLSFIPEYYGYAGIKIARLQESIEISSPVNLMDVINGASPDYAVVAQKAADPDRLAQTEEFFKQDYGLSLENLISQYDQRIQDFSAMADMIVHQAKECAAHAEARAVNAENLAARIQAEAQTESQRAGKAESDAAKANQRADQFKAQLDAVFTSHSWKITRPLRRVSTLVQFLSRLPGQMIKSMMTISMEALQARPGIKRMLSNMLWHFPRLRRGLRKISTGSGPAGTLKSGLSPVQSDLPAAMTPTAGEVYEELKKALENHCKGNQ